MKNDDISGFWSSDIPKETGFYWIRLIGQNPVIVWYYAYNSSLSFCGTSEFRLLTKRYVATKNIEFWSAKIEPPKQS